MIMSVRAPSYLNSTVKALTEHLLDQTRSIPVRKGEPDVPERPGIYAIFVDEPDTLPPPFSDELKRRSSSLLYLGMAKKNLSERLVQQDLRHRSPSTFFRGIGAVLGCRPKPGSLKGKANRNNYRFSDVDTAAIIHWIDDHVLISWVQKDEDVEKLEAALITALTPLLNTSHNRLAMPDLATLKAECRRIARGD